MGSNSDYSTMKFCEKILKLLKISYETNIVSAHRTPVRMFKYAKSAENNNISVIIAGAGGSAHLPGMIAKWVSPFTRNDCFSNKNSSNRSANRK